MNDVDGEGESPSPAGRNAGRVPRVEASLDALEIGRTPRTRVLRTIGEGGNGRIEAVLDEVLLRTAARKSLLAEHERNPSSLRRFVREARITSQLDHPSVVPVHELGIDAAGTVYFTLKLVEGRTLSRLVDGWRETGIDEGSLLDVVDALVKVCDALALAHSRGVVHCDVKPENIMIGDYGETYLMDWGAALVLPEGRGARGRGTAGALGVARPALPGDAHEDTISGTPGYMAPEQANGDADLIGPHTDVFGVGATLYEVLTGRSPYGDDEELLTLELAAAGRYPRLGELLELDSVPPLLSAAVDRAMALSIEDRYASVEQLKADLVRYLRGGDSFPVTEFEPGTVVVREGDSGECAYIISRGHCDVVKDLDGERVVVRRLGPGEVFGETALLSPGPRTASVVTIDDVTVQVIRRDAMTQELESVRPWLAKLLGTVASRFREADAQRGRSPDGGGRLRAARHATMFLHTFGHARPDGSRAGAWSALARDVAGDDARRAERFRSQLETFPELRVDVERDLVVLDDAKAFVAALAGEQPD